VWTSRLRSENFVWRHVLAASYVVCSCPSTHRPAAGCRLAFAQVVAAGPKRNFTFYSIMRFVFFGMSGIAAQATRAPPTRTPTPAANAHCTAIVPVPVPVAAVAGEGRERREPRAKVLALVVGLMPHSLRKQRRRLQQHLRWQSGWVVLSDGEW
jgi:hypothetical protein